MSVTEIRACPICGDQWARVIHGIRDGWHPESFLHKWDCRVCGEIVASVCYDCKECEEAESAYMAMCDVGHV